MAETKRYDVSGKPRGGTGRPYPEGTHLKLTDEQARAMGLTAKDLSKVTTTADSLEKRDRYEQAMTSQDEMRAAEVEAANAAPAETADADAGNKARTTRK